LLELQLGLHIEVAQFLELVLRTVYEVEAEFLTQSDLVNIVVQGPLGYFDHLRGTFGSVPDEAPVWRGDTLDELLPELDSGDGLLDGRVVEAFQLEGIFFFLNRFRFLLLNLNLRVYFRLVVFNFRLIIIFFRLFVFVFWLISK